MEKLSWWQMLLAILAAIRSPGDGAVETLEESKKEAEKNS
jgi:hypothetical protein